MSIATIIPVLYYYLIYPLDAMSTHTEILTSFLLWFFVGILLYLFVPIDLYSK
jgi:hypothetical protein